ncbi:MAG: hypothetical protein IKP66_04890, partial [Lachnospiraceae bacterium]|nr:hypothetical protein [Lachnospiraceae bacterium]
KNTVEGKSELNTHTKMANVLDFLIFLILNTVFTHIMFNSEYFKKYDDFNYKLDLIKNGIK